MERPISHNTVMPYIVVAGADKFVEFTRNVFNAKEDLTMRTMRQDGLTVMHSEINIDGSVIMFSDANEQFKPNPTGLFVYVGNADECYQKALAEGAQPIMAPTDMHYGRSCGVLDPLGNTWWITSL
jgi:uncharacterized glyoxalase superfamily protein PhnB